MENPLGRSALALAATALAAGTNSWWTAGVGLGGSDVARVNDLYRRGDVKIDGVPDS
ncbi:hypothetical protein ACWD0J_39165 [Streptomyces sp. NPDC003011]